MQQLLLGSLALVLLVSSGCGPSGPRSGIPRADVQVKILYGGEPVTVGSVDLNNKETGEGGGGNLDKNGVVKIQNVPHGDYVVTVIPPPPQALPGQDTSIKKYENIPDKFHSPEKSDLKLTVTRSGADVSFDLKQ